MNLQPTLNILKMEKVKINNFLNLYNSFIYKKILFYLILINGFGVFFSCNNNINNQKINKENNGLKTKDSTIVVIDSCNILNLIKENKLPSLAIRIYNNEKWNDETNMALIYFDSLNLGSKTKQIFYFKVIGRSVNKADGAYSEGLGFVGTGFIMNNTQKFISFFNHTGCVDNKDLINWVKILKLELSIDITIDIKQLKLKLKSNCTNCNETEISNLNKFCEMF